MVCPNCKTESPPEALFCSICGKKLAATKRRRLKSRGNGTGCAYYDAKHRYWVAQATVGYRKPEPFDSKDPKAKKQKVPVKKTKGGFKRREDALAYCNILKNEKNETHDETLLEIYKVWEPWYEPRIGKSTMDGYRAAFNYYGNLHEKRIVDITPDDLQNCMDACPRGKRTHQNMKVIAGLIWKYARDKHIVSQVESENLYTGKGKSKKREPLTELEVERIRQAIGTHRYAEYIYAQCYLGYRPGEMLELRKDQIVEHKGRLFLIEGKKTDAGRDRTVPVHKKIESIIRDRLYVPGTDLIFPQYQFGKVSKKNPIPLFYGFKEMTDNYFREDIFKPMMAKLGIAKGKVPYGARHTFSNKLKNAEGNDVDKAALMGHSNYTFTQTNYQSSNDDELLAIMDSIN